MTCKQAICGVGMILLATACGAGDATEPETAAATADPTTTVVTTHTTATQPPAEHTTTTVPAMMSDEQIERRTRIVDAQTEVWSTGDFDAWQDFYPSDANVFRIFKIGSQQIRDAFGSFMAANDQWTRVESCRARSATRLICLMHRRDDFHGAAGIEIEGNFWFDFSDEDELRSVNVESRTFDPFGTFASDFAEWLENAYPDIVVTTGFFDLPNAETMPIALDYVEEFVAQSPDYP